MRIRRLSPMRLAAFCSPTLNSITQCCLFGSLAWRHGGAVSVKAIKYVKIRYLVTDIGKELPRSLLN
jgi:hypothetical protein